MAACAWAAVGAAAPLPPPLGLRLDFVRSPAIAACIAAAFATALALLAVRRTVALGALLQVLAAFTVLAFFASAELTLRISDAVQRDPLGSPEADAATMHASSLLLNPLSRRIFVWPLLLAIANGASASALLLLWNDDDDGSGSGGASAPVKRKRD